MTIEMNIRFDGNAKEIKYLNNLFNGGIMHGNRGDRARRPKPHYKQRPPHQEHEFVPRAYQEQNMPRPANKYVGPPSRYSDDPEADWRRSGNSYQEDRS